MASEQPAFEVKHVDEVLIRGFDFAKFLTDSTFVAGGPTAVTGVAVAVVPSTSPGLVGEAQTQVGAQMPVKISGGVVGQTYTVKATASFDDAAGRKETLELTIQVTDSTPPAAVG